MEKKYYDTIVKLIQNHRKYPGLEAILDDIVADVTERANIVMNSVTNSDVVEIYLSKIVSTSIITVPKKLNFNRNVSHRVIAPVENKEFEKNDADVQEELVIINKDDNFDLALLDTESVEDSLENHTVETTEEITNLEDNFADDDANEPFAIIEENTIKESEIKEDSVDISLVDKMINGINNNNEILTIEDNIEDISEDDIIETNDVPNDTCDLEVTEIQDEPVFEFDSSEIENIEVLDAENDTNEIDDIDTVIEEDDSITAAEEEEEEEEVIDAVTENNSEDNTTEIIDLDEIDVAEDFSLDISKNEDIVEADELVETIQEDLVIDTDVDDDVFEQEVNEDDNNIEVKQDISSNTSPDYTVFNYEPEEISYDYDEVISSLKDLNTHNPELKLLEILDLKYKKGLTVEEIAETLSLDVSFVLNSLNEIIDTVKD